MNETSGAVEAVKRKSNEEIMNSANISHCLVQKGVVDLRTAPCRTEITAPLGSSFDEEVSIDDPPAASSSSFQNAENIDR
ncbi:hypothetical protein NPIL_412851 [Nephila pilipes]|uniref:Uncharacterized protein n=1 Tax=Nephila pilipes TaxID=299642 RepID=A0A8X6TDA9_NEPPI|nr:hypothetical protein NPIL_412851 [Nephila pilipes]